MKRGLVALGGLYFALVLVLAACSSGPEEAQPTPTPAPEVTEASPTPVVALPSPTHEATPSPTPEPTPASTPAATPTPAPTPAAVPTGNPFSFADFETAWQARDMTVTLGAPNVGFKGFATPAFDVRLARGSDSLDLSILIYEDRQAIREDWELTVGESPVPKEGRVLPDHISTWWNENIAVVVHACVGGIGSDVLDAFLALGEPTAGGATTRQLAYEAEDRGLWLVRADGTGKRLLTDHCPSVGLDWSPMGDMIACSYFAVVVFDLEGKVVWRTDDAAVSPIAWSPDGRRLAYQASDESLHIVDLTSQSDEKVDPKALPIAWPQPHRLLAGLNPQQGQLFLTYEAHWLDPDTGSLKRVPELDNANAWFLRSGERAVVLGQGGLAVLDVETSEQRLVTPLQLAFPSERLPFYAIAVSDDGTHFYAADASSQPTVIYRVNIDSGDVEELGTVPGVLLRISPEGIVAYLSYGGVPETLYLANLNTGDTVEVGRDPAWSPDGDQIAFTR